MLGRPSPTASHLCGVFLCKKVGVILYAIFALRYSLNQEIINRGYEFVAHTHTDGGNLESSSQDRKTLKILGQEKSTIIGIDGAEREFGPEEII